MTPAPTFALQLLKLDSTSEKSTSQTRFLCYPGKDPLTREYVHPSAADIKACRGRLLSEVTGVGTTKVLLVGAHAGKAVTGRNVVLKNQRCVAAGALRAHLLPAEVEVGLSYHPKARRADPKADVIADLRCLLG